MSAPLLRQPTPTVTQPRVRLARRSPILVKKSAPRLWSSTFGIRMIRRKAAREMAVTELLLNFSFRSHADRRGTLKAEEAAAEAERPIPPGLTARVRASS